MLFWTRNIAEIDGPVTFLLYNLEYYFFLNWRGYTKQLILEFINSFEKICPVFPKNLKNWSVKNAGFWP